MARRRVPEADDVERVALRWAVLKAFAFEDDNRRIGFEPGPPLTAAAARLLDADELEAVRFVALGDYYGSQHAMSVRVLGAEPPAAAVEAAWGRLWDEAGRAACRTWCSCRRARPTARSVRRVPTHNVRRRWPLDS